MSNNEDKMLRKFMPQQKKEEQKPLFNWKESFFGKDWYLESWYEKLIFVAGFVALVWTLIKLVFLHQW